MPHILSRPGSRRPSRSDHLLRVGEVALRFGAEACVQWWTIASRSWGYEVDRLVQGAMASVPPEVLLRGMASGYVNCLGELAAIAPSVAEKAAMELTRRSDAGLEPYIGDEHTGPEPDGEIFEVDGKPFAMPARVLDASQGWAMFFVDIKAANGALGEDVREILSAFDAGGGRTPLMIVGVDYRNSDFGVYPEFVVALTVTVKGDPAGQLFTYYLAIVVTQEFTKEAARVVWGLEKIVSPQACGPLRRGQRAVRRSEHEGQGVVDPLSAIWRCTVFRSADLLHLSAWSRSGTADLLGNDDEKRQWRGNADRRLGET